MIELVVLFHQIVDVIRDAGGAVQLSGLLHDLRIIGEHLDESLLFLGDGESKWQALR